MKQSKHVALWISGLLILIYIGQLSIPGMTDHLIFRPAAIIERPWTYLTNIFIHAPGDYMHLLNNLFFLVVFGTILERMIGSRRFLAIFLAGGLVANLTGFLYYQQSSLLGASGAISAVIAALAVFQPRKPGLFWGVPVPMWVALLGWIGTNSVGATATGTGIAFEAHLFGLGFGSLMGLYLRYRRPDAVRTEETGSVEIDERTLREWERRYMRD